MPKRGIDVIKYIYKPVDIKKGEKPERKFIDLVGDRMRDMSLEYWACKIAAENHPEVFKDFDTAMEYDFIDLINKYKKKLKKMIDADS